MFEPLTPLALLAHCALFLLIVGAELYRNRARRFDYLTLFSAAYLLNYAVVPIVYDVAGYTALATEGGRGIKQPPSFELDQAAVDILLGYGVFLAGFIFGRNVLRPKKSRIVVSDRGSSIGLALGAAGATCFFLYAFAYGGVLGLIKVAPLLRENKKIAATALVSASRFMGLAAFGLWSAASGLFERLGSVRLAQLAVFGAVALLAAMSTAGRTNAIAYFLPVILLWATRGRTRIPIAATVIMIVALVLWVDWAKMIAADLAGIKVDWTMQGGVLGHFLEDFYPTYASVPAALKHYYSTGQIFGLDDFGTALLHLAPQHLLGMKISVNSSKTLNTMLVGAVAGGRPPGLIGWSIYSLGPGYFLLWPLVYGTLAGVLECRYAPGETRAPYAFCIYMAIGSWISYAIVFDTDPTVYLNDSVWLITGILLTEIFVRFGGRARGRVRGIAASAQRPAM
jgi:hypothetical protein